MSASSIFLTNPTYVYVGAFADELSRAGIHHAVICPGSRSTPLALALASHNAIRVWTHVDERSAAFFALGMAKRLHQPIVLLCTSGTAAANFLPAIIEAKLTHHPLLILTADRPHELRECGAPQSIDQNRLYGTHVKWFVDVALPEASNQALRYIRTLACRAVSLTQTVPAGPVHLNMPLREPLIPEPFDDQPLLCPEQRDPIAWNGRPANEPYVCVATAPPGAGLSVHIERIAAVLKEAQRGLIIVGPLDQPDLAVPLTQLSRHTGFPILADPLSQLRCGSHVSASIISSYDALLRIDSFTRSVQPDCVLRFGAMPTSKSLLLYLQRYAVCRQIVVNEQGTWEEPTQLVSDIIHADPVAFCQQLLSLFAASPTKTHNREREAWGTIWQQCDQRVRRALHQAIQDFSAPFEGRVVTELAEILPDRAVVYVGNSMPVRDLDTFFWCQQRPIYFVGNRGANGIDGITSSALGYSAGAKEPVVLVIGDLSFFHDLNGLLAAHLHLLNLTIVLLNNDGGGIFSFLPQSAYPEYFEQLFATPIGLDFRSAMQMYGGTFLHMESWKDFRSFVARSIATGGLHVIEVRTEREQNVSMHRTLWRVVNDVVRELLEKSSW